MVGKCSPPTLCSYNASVFAYGQTGSGKTYTMSGPCSDNGEPALDKPEMRGMIQRTLEVCIIS